jgi:hypothetical protein
MNFAYEVFLSYLYHSLTCRKILRQGANGFTSPVKEVTVWTFITLKNPLPLAGFKPANHGSRLHF